MRQSTTFCEFCFFFFFTGFSFPKGTLTVDVRTVDGNPLGWRYSSEVEHLPSMCQVRVPAPNWISKSFLKIFLCLMFTEDQSLKLGRDGGSRASHRGA